MIRALLNLRVIYLVIAWVLGFGVWNVFLTGSLAKWSVLFALAWLATQACSATYWSYRWQLLSRQWQATAEATFETMKERLLAQEEIIEQLREPWRN